MFTPRPPAPRLTCDKDVASMCEAVRRVGQNAPNAPSCQPRFYALSQKLPRRPVYACTRGGPRRTGSFVVGVNATLAQSAAVSTPCTTRAAETRIAVQPSSDNRAARRSRPSGMWSAARVANGRVSDEAKRGYVVLPSVRAKPRVHSTVHVNTNRANPLESVVGKAPTPKKTSLPHASRTSSARKRKKPKHGRKTKKKVGRGARRTRVAASVQANPAFVQHFYDEPMKARRELREQLLARYVLPRVRGRILSHKECAHLANIMSTERMAQQRANRVALIQKYIAQGLCVQVKRTPRRTDVVATKAA